MRFYFLVLFCGVNLLSDLVFGLRFFGRKSGRSWWPFLLQALLLDVALPAVAISTTSSYWDHEGNIQLTLWLMWAVVAVFSIKVVFAAFVVLGGVVRLVVRRPVRLFDHVGAGLGVVVFVMLVWGASTSGRRVRVDRVQIASERIPAAFDGYRIAQFSDLHVGNLPKNNRLIRNVVDSIQSLCPDLIVQTGDLINLKPSELTGPVTAILSELRAPDGVASVLGNHDLGFYVADGSGPAGLGLLRVLQTDTLGWRLLLNDHFWIHRPGPDGSLDSIAVAGVGYPSSRVHRPLHASYLSDLRRALPPDTAAFSVLLSHAPMVWDSVPTVAAPDLTLAGHIHSMQVKFSVGKWRFSPAQWGYDHWSGLYQRLGKWLYVNDGAGYVFIPMRIGTPAQITLFTLKSRKK